MKTPAVGYAGYALVAVLIFTTAAIFTLVGVLEWASQQVSFSQRQSRLHSATLAADAACEQVVAEISADFRGADDGYVRSRLRAYASSVPCGTDHPYWSNYLFSDERGNPDRLSVFPVSDWVYGPLRSKYSGAVGYASTYRLAVRAAERVEEHPVRIALERDVQTAALPVFSFGAFYFLDLEVTPRTEFSLSGRIHANGNIIIEAERSLTFASHVTASGEIRAEGPVWFQGEHDSGVASLNLPVRTNNSPDVVRQILEMPPASEGMQTPLGQQRLYNQAILVVRIYANKIVATSGAYNHFSTPITWLQNQSVLETNSSFFDKRENKQVRAVDFDVRIFRQEYNRLTKDLGREPRIVFLADLRAMDLDSMPGLRLRHAETLPASGLTLASPSPLYVQGPFNADPSAWGTTNTLFAAPAALLCDAITILSDDWKDARSGGAISSRKACDVTVNAAVLAGIVPSANGSRSGGIENFFRHLENWSGRTFTFNGSMVAAFDSRIATAPWGATWDVYLPPARRWGFDAQLLKATRLPAGAPLVRTVIPSAWRTVAYGSSTEN